jgi:O-antigen/teichoic acid export membrane protein
MRNFIGVLIALSANTGIQILIQILSVPLFLHFYSVQQYSLWLVALNIAQISSLVDIGIISSSQNIFVYLARRKRIDEIKSRIEQFWLVFALNTCLILFVVLILNIFYEIPLMLTLIFFCSNCLGIFFGLYEALARIDFLIAKGLRTGNVLRLSEFAGYFLGLIFFKDSLMIVAMIGTGIKFLVFMILYSKIEQKNRFIYFGQIDKKLILASAREGFPFLITRISDYLMLSGVILLLHSRISAAELIAFSALRTFFRVSLQLTSLVNHTFAYEMSEAWAKNNYVHMKRLIRSSGIATWLFTSFFFVIYLFFGRHLFQYWTQSKISVEISIYIIGSFYAMILSLNQSQKTKYNAVNLNSKVSGILLIMAIIQLFVIVIIDTNIEINILFLSMLSNEIICLLLIKIFTKGSISSHFTYRF